MPVGPPEHRRHCRHDDRRKTFWAGLIKSPRARVKPKRRSVSSRKIRPHPPRFGLSAAEPEVRIHLSPALSLRTISVCRGRRPLGWFRRADCRSAPTRPKPRNRCLSGAELKFRIHSPPADSPSLARFLLPVSKSRQLPRCARARPGAMAGRDAQGSSASRQLPVTSLSGPFPVPQCRVGRFADRGCSGALSEFGVAT